jgi:serine/threonine protein kinase/TolB-like protein/Flp pilus assembly protein TadD
LIKFTLEGIYDLPSLWKTPCEIGFRQAGVARYLARRWGVAGERALGLTLEQMVRMSELLDQAIELDTAARRRWLEELSPDNRDLAEALRGALFPEAASALDSPAALPNGEGGGAEKTPASGLAPGQRIGPYELERILGSGGMAEVWLAKRADGAFRRDVALKLPMVSRLQKDLEERFSRERDILASLEHPNIARLYDGGIDAQGLPYLAMEYVPGAALTTWCDAKRLGIANRLTLMRQVLDAVQYAHERLVIYRDLKPSNILVSEAGEVRLLDFGVAKLLEETDGASLTRIYGRALTPDYASPELLRGDAIDPRSDIYSLGVVLYELLTGNRPYALKAGASLGTLEQTIATVVVKWPSAQLEERAGADRGTTQEKLAQELRGDLDVITLKALAKDPSERYENAAAMAEDLERYSQHRPIGARPAPVTHRLKKFVRRNRPLVLLGAIALIAVVGAVAIEMRRAPDPLGAVLAHPAKPLGDKSIVVLPFADMSEQKDQEYLADGISEELIDLLAQVPDLKVVARTSSFYFKGRPTTVAQIARALGVANVLEGSVHRVGETVRVNAELVRADSGLQLWSQSFERHIRDILKVQDEISAAVAQELKGKLSSEGRVQDPYRSDNPEAYMQYLLGRELDHRVNLESSRLATRAYDRAVALDANYAAAYAGRAIAESHMAIYGNDRKIFTQAIQDAERAIELAPEFAASYRARAVVRGDTLDFPGQRDDQQRALALAPNDAAALNNYGTMLAEHGHIAEAIAITNHAIEADPLSAASWGNLGEYLTASRRLPEARRVLERALEINPNDDILHADLGILALLERDPQAALLAYRQSNEEVDHLVGEALFASETHAIGRAARAISELISKHAEDTPYGIAQIYAWRHEKDSAFTWLERAIALRDSDLRFIRFDPLMDSIRTDPRYLPLLEKLKLID